MAIKKSKTVALEGRSDLTSLLGLIGRYGPTAALTVIAMLSLWAGFIIYKTVKRRRRKADGNVLGPEKDAVSTEGIATIEEETESSVESTEHIDEGLPEMCRSESVLTEMSETSRSSDASEDDDADWLPLELNDPGFSTELNREPSGSGRPDQAVHHSDQQEPASGCLFNCTTSEMERLLTMDTQRPSQSCLNAYSQGWSTNTEDQGTYPPQALDEDEPKEGPECADNLPDMENTDGDLYGPQRGRVYVEREVEISGHELTIKESTWTTSTMVKDGSAHVRDQLVCVEYVERGSPVNQPQPKGEDSRRVDAIDRLNQLMDESESRRFVRSGEPVEVQNRLAEQTFEPEVTGFIDPLGGLTSMIDQLMEPTKGRNPLSEFEKVEEVKSLDAEEQVCYEKTEINIMEATMDYNEWMTVDITEETMRIVPLTSFPSEGLSAKNHLQEDEDVKNVPADRKNSASTAPLDVEEGNKNVLVVQPLLPQMVHVRFSVHYLTKSPCQVLAVTGNQRELGSWKGYVPLERAKDGVWANSVSLPADSQVEWKFVLVEEGGIKRWEECGNRHLDTGHSQDVRVHKWWGYL